MNASCEARLQRYADLLTRWNPTINLVSPATLPDLWQRHIADSIQLAELAPLEGRWVDLGSGGGLPGLVVAICRPQLSVTLLDSDARKATFLRTCVRELSLTNCSVVTTRIEQQSPAAADHVSARALAPLPKLMAYVVQHLSPGGTAWLMKGETWQEEVDLVKASWQFDLTVHPSRTHDGAAILQMTNIHHG
ncbi:16S rRNA (guanine(527)-N(7))-methyltransferase RsmG [Paracoccus sp. Z118]|uniref:16S rRNA (guanine(527)-N(7))-methyltransferase RsmG n=1 Tax=Paracoccus sp. Z118 TaxID=2851017 RepID=UPI001C2C0FB8|nr:16S rRNA (guanine(527)-N(7))-methyltransferase RsmG [Paracoccus sp. Z118]MBV0891135.1 16S rRNA (guanine(527)-N(7))-methyltransferase RsmG [Paracoccus sp. Z118]